MILMSDGRVVCCCYCTSAHPVLYTAAVDISQLYDGQGRVLTKYIERRRHWSGRVWASEHAVAGERAKCIEVRRQYTALESSSCRRRPRPRRPPVHSDLSSTGISRPTTTTSACRPGWPDRTATDRPPRTAPPTWWSWALHESHVTQLVHIAEQQSSKHSSSHRHRDALHDRPTADHISHYNIIAVSDQSRYTH